METFKNVKKQFGFGVMRLPLKDQKADRTEFCRMVDTFLSEGFNYFDTAHGYLQEDSELVLRDCLTTRYPREAYVLTNKLSTMYFQKESDIRPLFEQQLQRCAVEYFDFYLMHAQSSKNYTKYKACKAYETAFALKAEGKIRHVGISFHDKAELLEQILTEYPQIEVVQIQFNYVDYEDFSVESRKCYETCLKYDKPVIVMEPVKGGSLAVLPEDAAKPLQALGGGSPASYAIRFAAGFPGVFMVLSGMSTYEQLVENISFMKDFKPLSAKELDALQQVREIFLSKKLIGCTACRYCTPGCPKNIAIPDLFSCMNARQVYKIWNASFYYDNVHTVHNGKASDCIRCGKCEDICPQHLPIRELLVQVAQEFETPAKS